MPLGFGAQFPLSGLSAIHEFVVSRCTWRPASPKAGFTVKEATLGTEALRLATEQPDLIILDVKLLDIHGFEVCQRLKAEPSTALIPVLHLSAQLVTTQDRVQGLE
jgi:DNA-binding response OmpR family regulator